MGVDLILLVGGAGLAAVVAKLYTTVSTTTSAVVTIQSAGDPQEKERIVRPWLASELSSQRKARPNHGLVP